MWSSEVTELALLGQASLPRLAELLSPRNTGLAALSAGPGVGGWRGRCPLQQFPSHQEACQALSRKVWQSQENDQFPRARTASGGSTGAPGKHLAPDLEAQAADSWGVWLPVTPGGTHAED